MIIDLLRQNTKHSVIVYYLIGNKLQNPLSIPSGATSEGSFFLCITMEETLLCNCVQVKERKIYYQACVCLQVYIEQR